MLLHMGFVCKLWFFFSSSDDEIEEDEEDIDADYEDSEYESTESELDEGCSNIKLTVPLNPHHRKKRCPHNKKVISSTEQESTEEEDSDSEEETEDSSEDSASESESIDDFSGSETNTECDFTDSEGRPNPFHKELEVPSILIDAGSPEVPGMRRYPEDIIEANTKPVENVNFGNRLYKTPNLADKPKELPTNSNYIGRSTQRAFNLKKHWVSDASNTNTNAKNSMEKSEVDNRLKSLMDRLSNQQKLLKPAEKPSKQMEHFMKGSSATTNGSSMKSISSDPLITSPLKSPGVVVQTTKTSGLTSDQKLHYAPPYQSIMNGIQIPRVEKPVEKPLRTNGFDPEEDEQKPPRPPTPEIFQEPPKKPEMKKEEEEPSPETTFESCNQEDIEEQIENHETIEEEPLNESQENSAFLTPANELSLNPEDLKESEDIPLADDTIETIENQEPLATSSPAVQELLMSPTESEKSFIQKQSDVKLTDDEIMRIYQERNPLERLAKFNSLKKKQSSVVHDMILSASSANKPRTRRTRVAIPSSSIPDPNNPHVTPIAPPRTRAATEPPMSLPATPLTGTKKSK